MNNGVFFFFLLGLFTDFMRSRDLSIDDTCLRAYIPMWIA